MVDHRLIFANILATRRRRLVFVWVLWNAALDKPILDGGLPAVLIIRDGSQFINCGSGLEYIVASVASAECRDRIIPPRFSCMVDCDGTTIGRAACD